MSKIFFGITGIMLILFCGLLVVDRCKLNSAYSKISSVIEEKEQKLRTTEQQHHAKQQDLNAKLQEQQRAFHVVNDHRSLMLPEPKQQVKEISPYPELKISEPGPFAQFNGEKELEEMAKNIAKTVKKPVTANAVIEAFRNLDKNLLPRHYFISDPQNPQRVINVQAALLEALCHVMGYQCTTELCWGMVTMKHFCKATLVSNKNPADQASFYFGDLNNEPLKNNSIVRQSKAISVLLPFWRFELSDDHNDAFEIMSDFHQVPIGGLYLHRIDVVRHPKSTANEWLLEYRFAAPVEPETPAFLPDRELAKQTRLRALSLLNGGRIISTSSEGLQSFRISFVDGKSSILIMGDTPVLPIKITARPLKAE